MQAITKMKPIRITKAMRKLNIKIRNSISINMVKTTYNALMGMGSVRTAPTGRIQMRRVKLRNNESS